MTRYLFLILIGCGVDPASGDDGSCAMGATQACTCATGGAGVQICDAAGAFGACGMCAPPDPDPTRVNFQAEIVPIIERSCGPSNGACHVRDMYAANMAMGCRGWLSLENASIGSKIYGGTMAGQLTGCPDKTLYQRLLTIVPWECPVPSYYIKASDPARSYIMNKINGAPLCSEGGAPSVQMPPSDSLFKLADADKALIQQWIMEGALDN